LIFLLIAFVIESNCVPSCFGYLSSCRGCRALVFELEARELPEAEGNLECLVNSCAALHRRKPAPLQWEGEQFRFSTPDAVDYAVRGDVALHDVDWAVLGHVLMISDLMVAGAMEGVSYKFAKLMMEMLGFGS
jgi:hypothetical protein